MPILVKLGIDPVHFGIVLVTNLTIAGVTPPVGQMMFISSQVLRVPMEDYTMEVLPFLAAMLVVLLLLTLFPQITLWLPDLLYGKAMAEGGCSHELQRCRAAPDRPPLSIETVQLGALQPTDVLVRDCAPAACATPTWR